MDTRLITFETVRELVGKSRTTLWRWEQEGKFPQRVQVGPNSVGWLRDEVVGWIEAKAAQRRGTCGDTTAPSSPALSEPRTTARGYKRRGYAKPSVSAFHPPVLTAAPAAGQSRE
jgi:prophage regulatory protein